MDMIRLLAKGVTNQEQLLNCAIGKVIKKKDQLVKALDGTLASLSPYPTTDVIGRL